MSSFNGIHGFILWNIVAWLLRWNDFILMMSWCWVNIGNWCFDDDISIDNHWRMIDSWRYIGDGFFDDSWRYIGGGGFFDNRLYIGCIIFHDLVFRFWRMYWWSNNIRVGVMSWRWIALVLCHPLCS